MGNEIRKGEEEKSKRKGAEAQCYKKYFFRKLRLCALASLRLLFFDPPSRWKGCKEDRRN